MMGTGTKLPACSQLILKACKELAADELDSFSGMRDLAKDHEERQKEKEIIEEHEKKKRSIPA